MIDIRLTKTEFMNGMRCGKMVWLDNHHPELKKLSPEVKELFARGNEFGDKAMGMFGEYEEMSAYFEDGHIDCGTMIKRTKQAIRIGNRLCMRHSICSGYVARPSPRSTWREQRV